MSKLVLGTANWGMRYGLKSKLIQQVQPYEIKRIIDYSKQYGVEFIDTAAAYGKSESILGSLNASNTHQIITKIPSLFQRCEVNQVFDLVQLDIMSSLANLKTSQIYGVLIHDAKELYQDYTHEIIRALLSLKNRGLIKKIGISVYYDADIQSALKYFLPDIIQIPANAFDQRLSNSRTIADLKNKGVEIHARSIFLQGILLQDLSELNSYFNRWMWYFEAWEDYCKSNKLTKLCAALLHLEKNELVDKYIVGLDCLENLIQIMDENLWIYDKFTQFEPLKSNELLNPSLWQLS